MKGDRIPSVIAVSRDVLYSRARAFLWSCAAGYDALHSQSTEGRLMHLSEVAIGHPAQCQSGRPALAIGCAAGGGGGEGQEAVVLTK